MSKRQLTKVEIRRELSRTAMPDVKKITGKYGLTIVQYCLNQIKDYNSKVRQLNQLKRDAKILEEEIK